MISLFCLVVGKPFKTGADAKIAAYNGRRGSHPHTPTVLDGYVDAWDQAVYDEGRRIYDDLRRRADGQLFVSFGDDLIPAPPPPWHAGPREAARF